MRSVEKKTMKKFFWGVLGAIMFLFSGCQDNLYVLPDPPPEQDRRSVSLVPGEEDRLKEQHYVSARASVLKLYKLLSAKRFEESLLLMSQETRDFLAFVSPKDKNPAMTLIQGQMVLKDGKSITMDPVAFLLATDLSKLQDAVDGMSEQESLRRKEIFAVQPDGEAKKIVVILEGGRWVLHRISARK